jgi:hypothetical protein
MTQITATYIDHCGSDLSTVNLRHMGITLVKKS